MHVDIHCQGFALTEGLRGHIERRLAFSLGRSANRIGRVVVRLSDINGPRGGIDKRCQIRARLEPSIEVVVEDTQADLYVAIDRATERVGRTVARSLGRHHSRFAYRALRNATAQPISVT